MFYCNSKLPLFLQSGRFIGLFTIKDEAQVPLEGAGTHWLEQASSSRLLSVFFMQVRCTHGQGYERVLRQKT